MGQERGPETMPASCSQTLGVWADDSLPWFPLKWGGQLSLRGNVSAGVHFFKEGGAARWQRLREACAPTQQWGEKASVLSRTCA